MKVNRLKVENIGKVASTVIELNKPLILLYGEIKQGKTTILNSVRWVCGGEFPQDIIRHGQTEGLIELEFDGGMISRSFYKAKDGVTKARSVVFVRNGKPVSSPVSEIKRFLNPFLLDQDFLRSKTELERKQYFSELFAVDTTDLDKELFDKGREASNLRSKITGYGVIDLTPAERVADADLKSGLLVIRGTYKTECDEVERENESARSHNLAVSRKEEQALTARQNVEELKLALAKTESELAECNKWIDANPSKALKAKPVEPDTSKIEQEIQNAGAANARADQFDKNKERQKEKTTDEETLSKLEARQREIRKEKQTKLKTITETCGIAGLSFDDEGNFVYEGTTAGMISDSQIMNLSSALSALYPEGLGLDLIDRGESLGKSIFGFVERATAEKKTILATIVGERPASVPENIGVFVVEEGKVS